MAKEAGTLKQAAELEQPAPASMEVKAEPLEVGQLAVLFYESVALLQATKRDPNIEAAFAAAVVEAKADETEAIKATVDVEMAAEVEVEVAVCGGGEDMSLTTSCF